MVQANPKDSIIRKEVHSVEFGLYSDEDVRCRSIVEITSSQAFDPTNNPLPCGLYDPRLGPLKDMDPPCPTCAVKATNCPGHFGHIELVVPVYHPLLFSTIMTALRLKCLNCHKFKAASRQLQIAKAKFALIHAGRINDVLELDQKLATAMHKARDAHDTLQDSGENVTKASMSRQAGAAMDNVLQEIMTRTTSNSNQNHRQYVTSHERQLIKQVMAECMSACKSAKRCNHCGAFSPTIRQDSSNKIFQSALSAMHTRLNQAEGIMEMESAMVLEEKDQRGGGYDSDDTAEARRRRSASRSAAVEDADEKDDDEDDDRQTSTSKKTDKYMHVSEVKAQLKRLWQTDPFLCNCLFGNGRSRSDISSYSSFFVQAIPVPPSRFRPTMQLNGMAVEHSQTQYLSKIIQLNEMIRNQFAANDERRAYTTWIELQTTVNCMMDSSKDPSAAQQAAPGIRQILERKEGLFRKNMMGKRVDYACRSVISPDPYVGTNEIGLPRYFATVLTYPTPVTTLNCKEMRVLVERGPHNYPGARWVELQPGRRIDLSKMNRQKREAIAAQLLTNLNKGAGMPAIVGRQLRDGDYVLMNRQPTLHKPGIMAHRVRILHNPTQKTIRMHYANCNTYNADFDGDEMNCHFPQSDVARAEAQFIARTDLQYIVPTDGSPLRGLIQDHVVGGVKLTKKDTFLEKWEYQQLLFAALASLPGLELIRSDAEIELVPPAIIKPRELWTGKQVITTLLLHLRKGSDRDTSKMSNMPGLSMEQKAKTPATAFGEQQQEHLVLILDGELLRGVLDKAAFGASGFSLVHAVYEAYGPEKAGLCLNSLGRLFTAYIQFYAAHSCRMEDLVLTTKSDTERRNLVKRAYNVGTRAAKAWADSEGGKVPIAPDGEQKGSELPLKPVELASTCSKIGQLLSGKEGTNNFAALDSYMQGQLNPLSSDIVKKCLPGGLAVPFPYNSFGVMTMTGAKGSIVNQSQVTCALGQQALEGRRVPRMSSGRTLPSFAPYDPNPRADGFVMDRFLTGIRPQEYYFHCMAGREGLVDTAVKTSRSGYLQRCLVKHLEELKICYDHTVRNAEGSIVQFVYGEDGLDPTKASFLDCSSNSFTYFARNLEALKRHNPELPDSTVSVAAQHAERDQAVRNGNIHFQIGDFVLARRLRSGNQWVRGNFLRGWHEAIIMKVHRKDNTLDLRYCKDNSLGKRVPIETKVGNCGGHMSSAISNLATIVKPASPDPVTATPRDGHRLGSSGACVSERVASATSMALKCNGGLKDVLTKRGIGPEQLSSLIAAKYSNSLCAPGEAVGCIAAQSIGEPSTQMTLNTFHLAGAGANVTLGIPRLREIIMTASKELKTPTMSIPLRHWVTDAVARRMTRDFTKLSLMELVSGTRGVSVTERLEVGDSGDWKRSYYVAIKFHSAERIKEAFGLTLNDIAKIVGRDFVSLLSMFMKQELRRAAADGGISVSAIEGGGTGNARVENEDDGSGEAEGRRGKTNDELDDEDDDADDDDVLGEEDGHDISRRMQMKEGVSYGDNDSDDDVSASAPQPTEPTEEQEQVMNFKELASKDAPTVFVATNTIALQPLRIDPAARPLLMVGLVEKAASRTLVRSKKNIDRAFANAEDNRGRCFQTAGINFEELWKLENVDHDKLMSNDIWAIRCAYGVEAARASIVQQITAVFGAYGIEVDPRHLSLIADYMTFDGSYKPMNRIGMESSSSTMLQMSFETTAHFLMQAAMVNTKDTLSSPSANIVVGRPIHHGTGAFSLLAKS